MLAQIPGHHAPPVIATAALVYTASILNLYFSFKQPAKGAPATGSNSMWNADTEDAKGQRTGKIAREEIKDGSWPGWTLLSGLPSRTSFWGTVVTVGTNVLWCLCVADVVYRAPVMHPSHELSFARVGYVSDTSAKILVREPDEKQLPVFVSYRNAPNNNDNLDDSWKTVGKAYLLTNETDYTFTVTINGLQPARYYQYAVSNRRAGQ